MHENEDNQLPPSKPPQLLAIELRVLGALMEKQLTTPDQYPLTMNSIITACNQKSSREPVTNYHQGEVNRALNELEQRHFVRKEFGSRADKYSQHFMSQLELGKKQQALLCIMMLRGPQTLSELNTRTQRMGQFSNKEELAHCLERLCERDIPLVVRLGQQPGQRGERFGHLFSGNPEIPHQPAKDATPRSHAANHSPSVDTGPTEVAALTEAVNQLKQENLALNVKIEQLYELTGHTLPSD
jgi:uncharacterized protein YceH (UPF0502 family)